MGGDFGAGVAQDGREGYGRRRRAGYGARWPLETEWLGAGAAAYSLECDWDAFVWVVGRSGAAVSHVFLLAASVEAAIFCAGSAEARY